MDLASSIRISPVEERPKAAAFQRLSDDPKRAYEVAQHRLLGKKIRALRLASGLSQEDVGKHMGHTFQAQQKLESGQNRLDFVRLQKMATLFKVPISAFATSSGVTDEAFVGMPEDTQTARLLRAFMSIRRKDERSAVMALVKHFANRSDDEQQSD